MYQPSQKGAVCRPISIRPDEKSVAWLPGFLGQLVTIWSIDSYPRRIDAYPRLKRRVSLTFEQETCLLSRSTFCGRFMRQNGFRAKLCVREIIFDSSIQAQWAGEVIRQNWRGYDSFRHLTNCKEVICCQAGSIVRPPRKKRSSF